MERRFGFVCVQILMCFNVLVAFISAYMLNDIYMFHAIINLPGTSVEK